MIQLTADNILLRALAKNKTAREQAGRAAVKAAMRGYSLLQAKAFARRALACKTAGEVRQLPLP